ncbi:MAG TPA: ATP-binding protein [Polyangia bacterium]
MNQREPSDESDRNSPTPARYNERGLFFDLSNAMSTTLELDLLVQVIADGVSRLLGVETTAVYLVEEDDLSLAAATPPLDPDLPASLRRAKREDHPHIDQALKARRPIVLPDTSQATLSPAERSVVELRGLRSLLYLPFYLNDDPIGLLIIGTVNVLHTFGEHEIDLCSTLANQLAIAVQNARLHSGLKKYAKELETQMAERARLEERLRHAQKMEALGQLAGGVAHDFNNLLQVMIGYASSAREQLSTDEEPHQSIGFVLQAADRAKVLVRQLLTFARRQVLSLEVVDVNRAINALNPILRPLLGERILLSMRLDADQPRVLADNNQIEQILINLVINARDAMPAGGTVTIATQTIANEDARRKEIDLPSVEPLVRISVIDSGLGMDEETRLRAFEPFFTTKRPGEGTGLGLAMVHGLMAQHNGVVNIVSGIGQGTTIDLYFPTATATRF